MKNGGVRKFLKWAGFMVEVNNINEKRE